MLRDSINLFPFEVQAPNPKYLLEQIPETGNGGLIQAFNIGSQWTHYRQALPKSQECLRWVRKVKSWSVHGFFKDAVLEKKRSDGEKGVRKRDIHQLC